MIDPLDLEEQKALRMTSCLSNNLCCLGLMTIPNVKRECWSISDKERE